MERDQALTGTIALLALSGYEANHERTAQAERYFTQRGLQVLTVPLESARSSRFSANDAERLKALDDVLAAPTLRIVLGLRGGYGLSRLLDRIDYAAIAQTIGEQGVRWVGHSDWTALTLALWAQTGAVSYAGPLAAPDFGVLEADPFTERQFWSAMRGEPLDLEWNALGPDLDVAGPLWGGNLTMLASLVGTSYLPRVEKGILFIEDVNEHPYRIERMLLQLQAAGILERQQALLLGDISGYRLTDYDQGYDLSTALGHLRERSSLPIIDGLPFGHGRRKATLPVGTDVRLTVRGAQVRLSSIG